MTVHAAELLLETLRFEGGPAAGVMRAAWAATRTGVLPRLVRHERCALWLYRRLGQIVAADTADRAFTTWLARRARGDTARNLLVDAQVITVLRYLVEDGIPHVLLKGAARRVAADRFPFADARATHDVDVLVPASAAERAWQGLRRRGYELADRAATLPPRHFHLPPVWDASRVAVELHTSTSPAVPSAEAWRRANAGAGEVACDGIHARIPSATELLWHGLTHALRHHADGFRLRFLLDGAAILAGGVDQIDWPDISHRLDLSGELANPAAARAWMRASGWLAGVDLPASVTAGGGAGAHGVELARLLRWRCAVLRLFPPTARFAAVLVMEGTRLETRLGRGYSKPAASPLRGAARLVGAVAARAVYRIWRAGSR